MFPAGGQLNPERHGHPDLGPALGMVPDLVVVESIEISPSLSRRLGSPSGISACIPCPKSRTTTTSSPSTGRAASSKEPDSEEVGVSDDVGIRLGDDGPQIAQLRFFHPQGFGKLRHGPAGGGDALGHGREGQVQGLFRSQCREARFPEIWPRSVLPAGPRGNRPQTSSRPGQGMSIRLNLLAESCILMAVSRGMPRGIGEGSEAREPASSRRGLRTEKNLFRRTHVSSFDPNKALRIDGQACRPSGATAAP